MSKLKPCEEAVDHEAPNGERERTGEVEKERERLEERGGEIDEMGDGGRERQREREAKSTKAPDMWGKKPSWKCISNPRQLS